MTTDWTVWPSAEAENELGTPVPGDLALVELGGATTASAASLSRSSRERSLIAAKSATPFT